MTNVEVIDLVCTNCKHIIRATADIIEKEKLEKCKICYYPNGLKRSLKVLWKCAGCNQVDLQSGSHLCFCTPKERKLEIHYPHMKPNPNKMKDEIMMDKELRKLGKKIQARKLSPILVQEEILRELVKLNKSNEENQKHTEMKLDAIG